MTQVATDKSRVPRTSKDWDLRAIAPFVALALLLVLGAIVSPNFTGLDNLLNVMTRAAFIAIIAVGATYVISSGCLDLSVGSMVAFVASLMILFINSGVIADPVLLLLVAVLLALVLGAACGLLNGLITTVGGIEPFIATLGTMGIYRGLTTWLSQGGAITLRNSEVQAMYRPVYSGYIAG
ncbi:MAG TPA: ABC transporter permease, partial [Ochrobactrum sp.]|nr:ABC transporter permease [Ochrobactrum sp.]